MTTPATPRYHRMFWLLVIVLSGGFLYLISPILMPFIVGMGLAYILDPLADRLEAKGFGRTAATLFISGIFFAITGLALFWLIPALINQIAGFVADIPTYFAALKQSLEPILARFSHQLPQNGESPFSQLGKSLGSNAQNVVTGILKGVMQSGIALINFASLLLITPLVSFYLLRDWDVITARLDDLLPRKYAPVIREQFHNIDHTLSAFLRGQLNVMLVLATFYAITLSIAGLKYSLLVALLAGLLIIVPYIGTLISGALAVGIAYAQFEGLTDVAIIAAIFIIGQILEGYVLTPKLVGGSVGLNPLWIIFGMLAGGTIMGFVGILIAVPFTAICGVLLRFAIAQYRNSAMYDPNG